MAARACPRARSLRRPIRHLFGSRGSLGDLLPTSDDPVVARLAVFRDYAGTPEAADREIMREAFYRE
jgi:hypothetical protein